MGDPSHINPPALTLIREVPGSHMLGKYRLRCDTYI